MKCLWRLHDFYHAIQGTTSKEVPTGYITGISIDSRSIEPGEAFFAIKGHRYDGHDYVMDAIHKKASLVVINSEKVSSIKSLESLEIPILLVENVLSALKKLAIAARLRSKARIIAITGSVGKTTTKEMLKQTLSSIGKTHVCRDSYNNHIGVPLTLACLSDDAEFGIFELGMSHSGEIRLLTELVRPHIAVITTVAPAHIGNFSGMEEIASAKAEIIEGLEKTGSILLNHDNAYFGFIKERCHARGIHKIFSFGQSIDADFQMLTFNQSLEQSCMTLNIKGQSLSMTNHALGKHMAYNILATLGVASLLNANVDEAISALSAFHSLKGRGKRYRLALNTGFFTLIDESYNANPASMAAAISVLAQIAPYGKGRRIAVLGDMGDLGEMSESFHADLAIILSSHHISHVWLMGKHMMALKKALPKTIHAQHYERIEDLLSYIQGSLREGDVMLIKSSHMCGFDRIVQFLLEK
ncbi:MAG: UDP-N-acetylmuramoyl-tripeptide--D-alanyl-D-alanine ligase [Candidatus Liberibacter ctenarytainae]|uniref:UDP-N-acetylmuramoyl-tripeptide--D-alanyl-D-alanine ligase n=1 Tax=Candidatus Liberibacter ctenarytainae TaxID=2020335 RepID=A0A937ACK9_9HYPH|nr:UDP-N-acetylmuramoyl-tripeptide--D-alanyl-D-alanine ligase [Candidatus Liberibacter ctenarytainae]